MNFIKKLDSRGLAHFVMPLVVVIGIAVVGTFMLVASHADSPTVTTAKATKVKTGSVKLKAFYCSKPLKETDVNGVQACQGKLKTSRADISVSMQTIDAKGRCNSKAIDGMTAVPFGAARKLKCTPGDYIVTVANGKSVYLLNKAGTTVKVLEGNRSFSIESSKAATPINLYAAQ